MRNETALGLAEARGPWARVLRFVLYAALFMVFAGPLLALMVGAFTPTVDPTQFTLWPDRLSLDNLERAVDRNVLDYLLNSFLVVGGGLALQVLVSVFAGYALARKRFRGSAVVLVLILATMMLPEEVLAVPLSVLLADLPLLHVSVVGSLVGMIVPVAAWGFSILVMTEFMKEIPKELEESARLDGAGEFRVFWQVVLPLSPARAGCHRHLRLHDDLGPVHAAAAGRHRPRPVHPPARAALPALRRPGGHRRAAGGRVPRDAAVGAGVPHAATVLHPGLTSGAVKG